MTQRRQQILFSLSALALALNITTSAAAALSISGDTSLNTSQVIIGNSSLGTFRIDGGSNYSSIQASVTIGLQQSGIGLATVTGPGSQWLTGGGPTFTVGNSGMGRLEILDGGVVTFNQFGNGMVIASQSSSHGTVIVDGTGSLLSVTNILIGGLSGGSALLRIANDAIVHSNNNSTDISPSGRLELDGGLLRTQQLHNEGVIAGSGEIFVSSSFQGNTGRIEAGAGQILRISGSDPNANNHGEISADGGEIEFHGAINNAPLGPMAGEINLRNGVIRLGTRGSSTPQLTNSAVLAATGGVNDLYGTVSNVNGGRIAVTNQSVMIFHDAVTADSGTITVFPGSSAVFLKDLVINEGATLLADLAGTSDDTGFGEVEVVGNAQLAGALDVTLASGYTPAVGDSFPLVTASTISGSLSLGSMPALPAGLMWSLNGDDHHVVLSVVPGLEGDYNNNGVVDAADYIVWRTTRGQSGDNLPADGDGSGTVDGEDYDFWRNRFGNGFGGSGPHVAAIPEPATAVAFLLGLVTVYSVARKPATEAHG